MRETQWEFGSVPQSAVGLEDIGFVTAFRCRRTPSQLTWQNLVPRAPATNQPIELRPQDIDTLIRLAGRGEEPEAVLYTTLHADTAGGIVQTNNHSRWSQPRRDFAPRWRSMVTGAQHHRPRSHPQRVPGVLGLPAGRASRPTPRGCGW